MQSVEFSQHNGLNNGETLSASGFEILIGLFSVQPVKQFPTGISEPEKSLSISEQIVTVGTGLELRFA
jgi:hypothetical protein